MSAISKQDFSKYINDFDFKGLFIDMGWHNDKDKKSITVDDETYTIQSVAEMHGFKIFICESSNGLVPLYKIRRQIEASANKLYPRLLIIFIDSKKTEQVWLLVTRIVNQRTKPSEVSWSKGKSCELLYQRASGLGFEIDDEGKITIVDVTNLVNTQFSQNNERVTKKFYERFRKEHDIFLEFITGIEDRIHKDWYTSLMLNRLMFCYFIQKRRFLDNDPDYLQNRLKLSKEKYGKGKFYSFYHNFLLSLFHDGLGQPVHSEALKKEIGNIPYLNGGLFEAHELERTYKKIDIPDEAFENIFTFFDAYQWTLDTRANSQGDEVNPDVIGYIFEKYINNRAQNGAYYTKEDITEYIGKNCIIPNLFDTIEHLWPHPFNKEGDIWRMVRSSGDAYIYDAVKKGMENKLPPEIEKGIKNVSERTEWNRAAPKEYALPTEIWREVVERRNRYVEVKEKIKKGSIHHINDFITYNLNIRQLAQDAIEQSDDPEFIKAYWEALNKITILDPTCGSGAFLFAALNILEPLYDSCITRIRGFVEDEDRKNSEQKAQFSHKLVKFREILSDIQNPRHPNQKYFIYKTIILNNLYGVDIMNEAVEIAKLRLFLKLVATVEADYRKPNLGLEPLPDIDFNIRSGNTLVGFATQAEIEKAFAGELGFNKDELDRILENCATLASEFALFQQLQLTEGSDGYSCKKVKKTVQTKIVELRDKLNAYLASVYGKDPKKKKQYEEWLASHQPFHWFAEFYNIIAVNGGFDVVIGNPPYVELRQIDYIIKGLESIASNAVHAMCIERTYQLINKNGNISMIVPLALVCTQRMVAIQNMIENERAVWYANFAWRPGKLFDTVNRALTIFISNSSKEQNCNNTGYTKWYSETREHIFHLLNFTQYNNPRDSFWAPKLSSFLEISILCKLLSKQNSIQNYMDISKNKLYYRTTGGLYWKIFTDIPPVFILNGKKGTSSRETFISLKKKDTPKQFVAIFSSSLFWWWYTITSNLRDLNPSDLNGFKIDGNLIGSHELINLADIFIKDINQNSSMLTRIQEKTGTTKTQSFKISKSKHIIDEIDKVLAKHYGFTDEELDFIINYDIKYRMGSELEEEEG